MNEAKKFLLSVDELSKTFTGISSKDRFPVLKSLSFNLLPGKILSVLGASGCGKTTLLKIIAGLESADSGTIFSNFKRPGSKIGFLQQSERLLPWRSVQDNVALGLELIGTKKSVARAVAANMLANVGMSEFAGSYPSQLSGGMTQRVLLARTLITQPAILLFDEPLGQLDVVARKDLAQIIRKYVNESNAAALLVTHSVEEAIFVSDFILTLSRRPAQFIGKFSLNGDQGEEGFTELEPSTSFETVLQSLLAAIGGR